jgi:hypothetical protein
MIQYITSMVPDIDRGTTSSFNYVPSNTRRRKTSTGKHLCSYFACKPRNRRHSVISGSTESRNDNNKSEASPNPTCFHLMETYDNDFHPIDDPSYQDNTWYDAISPYWTGGMVWNGAYTLNHQVVSVTTDPIFVSNLLPAVELSGTIQTTEARSGDENVGPRATIALQGCFPIN